MVRKRLPDVRGLWQLTHTRLSRASAGTLAMGLEYYTHVLDLSYLTGAIANDDTVGLRIF